VGHLVCSLPFLGRGLYLLRMCRLRTHALWNHCSTEKKRIDANGLSMLRGHHDSGLRLKGGFGSRRILTPVMGDPHGWVVGRIAASIEKYVRAFNLFGCAELLGLSRVRVGRKQSTWRCTREEHIERVESPGGTRTSRCHTGHVQGNVLIGHQSGFRHTGTFAKTRLRHRQRHIVLLPSGCQLCSVCLSQP
jgi:hypothetical protein